MHTLERTMNLYPAKYSGYTKPTLTFGTNITVFCTKSKHLGTLLVHIPVQNFIYTNEII